MRVLLQLSETWKSLEVEVVKKSISIFLLAAIAGRRGTGPTWNGEEQYNVSLRLMARNVSRGKSWWKTFLFSCFRERKLCTEEAPDGGINNNDGNETVWSSISGMITLRWRGLGAWVRDWNKSVYMITKQWTPEEGLNLESYRQIIDL